MNWLKNFLTNRQALTLTLLWAVLTLPTIGMAPLFDYDETIYAQTAVDMMRHGEWIVPIANGMQFFEKPPFTYYMMDAAFALFGDNAFAARLPSALFTLFTMLLLFRFGRDLFGARFGVAAALIFLSMLEVGLLAHAAILDPVLNFFIAGALLNYFRWLQDGQRKSALWTAAMMGLAVSIKGPVGAVVPLMVIFIERLWAGELMATLRRIPWAMALPLFILTAIPWYAIILIVHGPGFLYDFIVIHNIGRAMHPMQGHGGKWHYYLVVFAVSVLPWLAFVPWMVKQVWQTRASREPLPHLARLALVWTVSVIVLFSFVQTKLPHYISCIYPAAALGLAAMLARKAPDFDTAVRLLRASAIILLPVAAALLAFPFIYGQLSQWVHHPRALAILAQDVHPSLLISGFGLLLLANAAWLWRRLTAGFMLPAMVVTGLLLQISLLTGLGTFAGQLAQGPQMRIAAELRGLPAAMPVYSYNLNAPSISFYAGRNYRIALNQKGIAKMQEEHGPYAVILRSEATAQLPMLTRGTVRVDRGGYLLYTIDPASKPAP
jgi:4-amino-4-deoxy-L-arabinose transferase-like glycosyltransferase